MSSVQKAWMEGMEEQFLFGKGALPCARNQELGEAILLDMTRCMVKSYCKVGEL